MPRKYSKLNFVDAVKIITPDFYLEDDLAVSGNQVKLTDLLINSHLVGISKVADTLDISSIPWSYSTSNINTASGFGQFFVKQNKFTEVTPYKFQRNLLEPLGYEYTDYATSSEFHDFLSGTLLPKIQLNSSSLAVDTSSRFASTASGTHEYLIKNFGWLYLLNTSGPVESPSSVLASSISTRLYTGKDYLINDGVKDYQRYLWNNYSNFSSIDPTIIPGNFLSGTGSYTSGTQNLEKLQTLVDVAYSPLYIDQEDTTVKDAIEAYIGSSDTLQSVEVAGPFNKFLRAVSYSFRDLDNQMESLETLASIKDCPADYLPYLAKLVGWKLYGKNPDSWRNQIRNATSLYKKKGTKTGLIDALNTIIIQNPIDVSSAVTEMYESYIPQLLYYFLLTETDIFDPKTYTKEKAESLGIDPRTFSFTSKDHNVRAAVDSIIHNAVQTRPFLFFIRNEPFRLSILENGQAWFGPTVYDGQQWYTGEDFGPFSQPLLVKGDDNFVFSYRNRSTPVPPWDEPKFYKNCAVTKDLLNFYAEELNRFCVPKGLQEDFVNYTSEYILNANDQSDLYLGNGYVFFTSSLQQPPNYDSIIDNMSYTDYDVLSLWNGKSSTFDFTVCAGDFSSILFQDSSSLYSTNDILASLEIVDDFVPAKSIPRTRVVLGCNEYVSGIEYQCPQISYGLVNVPGTGGAFTSGTSGNLANFEVCGSYIRGTGKALGEEIYSGFNDDQSFVNHDKLPVFRRDQVNYAFNASGSVVNTTLVVPPTANAVGEPTRRKSLRRRNFHNVLDQKGWYGRDGHNMPSFYNNTSSILDNLPLGFIPSSMSFADASPENLSGVYSKNCEGSASKASYFGLNVSNAILARNYGSLQLSSCDPFVRRNIAPEEVYTLWKFNELKKKGIASEIVRCNQEYHDACSTWVNFEDSYANQIEDISFDKYLSPELDKRGVTAGSGRGLNGIQYVYNTYNDYFLSSTDGSSLPEKTIKTIQTGGPTILSHTYGPLYFNANFSIEGSAISNQARLSEDEPGTLLLTNTFETTYPIQLNVSGPQLLDASVGVSAIQDVNTPYYGKPEFAASHFLSGLTLIDTSSTDRSNLSSIANTFILFDLNNSESVANPNFDNYLIQNPSVYMKSNGIGLPRIKYDLSGFTQMEKNILVPEHDFELEVKYATGKSNTARLGGGNIGVVIRTKTETIVGGEKVVFFWTPDNVWKMEKVSSLTNSGSGIDTVLKNAHFFSGAEEKLVEYDAGCNLGLNNNTVLKYVTESDIQSAKISFHTKNNLTELPFEYATYYNADASTIYTGRRNQLHRANIGSLSASQDYIVELFQTPKYNPEEEFVLFDSINVVDKTLNSAAELPLDATVPDHSLQADPTVRGRLLNSKGAVLGPTVGTEGLTSETSYFSNDLLRNFENSADLPSFGGFGLYPALSVKQDLWTKVGAPYYNNYRTLDTGEIFAGADIAFSFLSNYPKQGTPLISNGAPWGKVPFTGICNNTWTCYWDGLSEMGLDTITEDDLKNKIAEYFIQRKGFLSENEWSPYINNGEREQIGANASPNQLIGQGLGQAKWVPSNHRDNQGMPLLGIARPGHSYSEQWLASEHFLGDGETQTLNSNFGYVNPLGFTRADDEFDYNNLDSQVGFGIGNNYANRKTSVGSPIMMDFTTRRVRPDITDEGQGSESSLNSLLSDYNNEGNWSYSPESDYLLPKVLDPTGMVASGLSIFSLMDLKIPGGGANTMTVTAYYDSLIKEAFFEKGHGITFPPMSTYRDIGRDKLQHLQDYSFQVYVRGQDTFDAATKDLWATSAIVTLAPIGSNNSYTRLVLSLGDMTGGAADGTAESSTHSSTILTNGHSYTGADAAAVEEVEVVRSSTNPQYGKVSWYKIRVTLPYNAYELDAGGEPNLGLRCTVQAWNNRFDGGFPDELPQRPDNQDTVTYVPCKLLTWGYGLYVGKAGGDFTRKQTQLTRMGTKALDEGVSHPGGGIYPAIAYESNLENILTSTENVEVFNDREIYHDENKELHTYDKASSGLQKLTYIVGQGSDDIYNGKLYKGVNLYDNSGALYSGPMLYTLNENLVRPADFDGEPETNRSLTISGVTEGTNFGKSVSTSVKVQPIDLLHLFRYFNTVGKAATGKGFNTRVLNDSSGVHEASGGSRLSYRVLPDLSSTVDGTFKNFTNIYLV